MSLDIVTQELENQMVRVVVTGEVDVSCAGELREHLDPVIETAPATIELDLANVPYIDSTGIGVLVGGAHRAQDAGSELVIVSPQPNVLRVLTMLGVGSEFNVREA
jgi:anti-sigma B factor antagonist